MAPRPSSARDPHGELTVVLADDEPLAREGLAMALARMEGVRLLASTRDAEEAIAAVRSHGPDLLLLDIAMPGMSGMALARRLERSSPPEIVFVTAYQDFAPEAFEVEAADFVLKPVDPDRLGEAVARARRRKSVRHLAASAEARADTPSAPAQSAYLREFWVPHRGGAVRVPVASIDWIEAARDYVLLHTALRTHIYRTTMAKLETELDPDVMLRVHRSAIVNKANVTGVNTIRPGSYALKLEGGALVRVGRLYASAVLARVMS